MSFDLYRDEVDNRLATLPGAKVPDPGAWDNFLSGTGRVAMQGFAKAGSAVDLLGAVGPIVQDKLTGGTEAQDRYFKEHDEVFGRAVDYWTPKPNEVGAAGQIAGSLLSMLPMVLASPALAVATTQVSTGEDLVKKGVDSGTAQAVGAVQAAGLGLGIWVPILGKTLAQRVLLGGAGFNVVQGVATRGASEALLDGTAAEGDFKAFDPTMLTLDVLLGAAFGGVAHLHPAMRAEGDAWHKRMTEWGAKLKPSEVDALVTLRQAQHLNADSMPGQPADMQTATAHVDRMRKAIDDLANDRPVQIEDMPAGRFEADPARRADAEASIKAMQDEAAKVAEDEGVIVGAGEAAPVVKDSLTVPQSAQDAAIAAARKVQNESNAFEIAEEVRSLNEGGGVDISRLADDPKYWDSENEQLTKAGLAEYDRLVLEKAKDNLRLLEITELSDLDMAFHKAQYAAMKSLLDQMMISYVDTSSTQSKYLEVAGYKVRFADHANQVRDSAIRGSLPVINVAPNEATFTEALNAILKEITPAPDSSKLGSRTLSDQDAGAANLRADGSGQSAEPAQSGSGAGSEFNISDGIGAGKAALDPLAAEAIRFANDNPDVRIQIGRDANDQPITVTPREMLEQAEADLAGAQQDARLFDVAAACLLGAK